MSKETVIDRGKKSLYLDAIRIHFLNQGCSEFEAEWEARKIMRKMNRL